MDDDRRHGWDASDPATEAEIDALSAAWNAMVAGDSARPRDLDPEIAGTLHRMDRMRAVPPPRRAFARNLKEDLMNAPALALGTTTVIPGSSHGPAFRRPAFGTRRFWTHTLPATFAAAAIIAVIASGLYYGLLRPNSGGPGNTPTAGFAAQTNGTPVPVVDATPKDPANAESTVIEADLPLSVTAAFGDQPSWDVGSAAVYTDGGVFTKEQLAGDNLRVDDVTLQPGSTSTYGASQFTGATGFAVDFVLDGATILEFDTPVIVGHSIWALDSAPPTVVPAGQQIELVRGDSVAYPLGAKAAMSNPLISTALRLKTVYVFDGMIPEFQNGNTDELLVNEVNVAMPAALAESFEGGTVYLNFLNTDEALPAGTQYQNKTLVAGPFGRTDGTKTFEHAGFYVWMSPGFG